MRRRAEVRAKPSPLHAQLEILLSFLGRLFLGLGCRAVALFCVAAAVDELSLLLL